MVSSDTYEVSEVEGCDKIKVAILQVGEKAGIGIAIGIGLIGSIGLSIKGLFMYYIRYHAQKQRPINTLMFYDQVSLSTDIKIDAIEGPKLALTCRVFNLCS